METSRRHRLIGALLAGAIGSACASIMGVDEPTLAVATNDGGVGEDGNGSGVDVSVNADACIGEGCPCTTDGECRDGTFKSCVAGKCAECTTQPDNCTDNRFCLASKDAPNACAPGCKTNNECAALSAIAKYCNTSRHQCVGCLGDGDCTSPLKCSPSGTCAETCAGEGGACPNGQQCCGNFCVDTKSDVLNCNGCGTVCGTNGANALCCDSQCTAYLTDKDHCGSCSNKCSTTNGAPSCTAGNCKWTCNTGFHHCAVGNTGCETSTSANPAQCGGCEINCNNTVKNANGVVCASSLCSYTGPCNGTFSDCDGNRANGCECTCPLGCTSCNAAGECQIDCTPGNCDGPVVCPAGRPCRVRCLGENACQGTLACPAGFPCMVVCHDSQHACNGFDINADNSALCVSCDGASQACNGITCTEPAGTPCKQHCGTSACNSACGNCSSTASCP